jgi:hypothetical protein
MAVLRALDCLDDYIIDIYSKYGGSWKLETHPHGVFITTCGDMSGGKCH